MNEGASLSELCVIWSVSPYRVIIIFLTDSAPSHLVRPKYKCPRCTIQTCSLSCVKRHKLWSQCSGTRDPAAYRKRHQLATPSSFDQDFNFITRVERTIERAADVAEGRGIPLSEERRKRIKGEARRDAEIEQRAAIVLKAPPGMSRALQNKSKWDNRHKCLLWTVEWILQDGARVFGNCQETRTITEAFANAVGKRKIKSQQGFTSKTTLSTQGVDSKSVSEIHDGSALNAAAPTESISSAEHHFYLHRPNLPSHVRCVVPLQSEALVKDVIRDRVVIEFPTIFVLGVSKDKLQKPFVTEEEYLEEKGNGPPVIMSEAPEGGFTADDNDQDFSGLGSPPELDEKKIKEVLQKDLGT